MRRRRIAPGLASTLIELPGRPCDSTRLDVPRGLIYAESSFTRGIGVNHVTAFRDASDHSAFLNPPLRTPGLMRALNYLSFLKIARK